MKFNRSFGGFHYFSPKMSSPRKPKPGKINLKAGPKEGGDSVDSPTSHLAPQLADLSIPKSLTLDLKPADIVTLLELGSGIGGTVTKVSHAPSNTIMARKVLWIVYAGYSR